MTISLKANAAGTQGEIFLNGTPVQTFNQNTLQVSGNVLAGAAQDNSANALTRKDYVDGTFVKKVGQTWKDVTVSKAFGTGYVNNTGQPIKVFITCISNQANGQLEFYIGGLTFRSNVATGSTEWITLGELTIPPGASYSAGSSTVGLHSWLELS